MKVTTEIKDNELTAVIDGRLDTTSAPKLDAEISPKLVGIKSLTLDFTNLAYISSAGLRVLLMFQKKINQSDGKMTVVNPNELVSEVFEVTGFSDILNIEKK